MVVLASTEQGASVLGTPPADLLLKIVGTARDGQVIRLTNRKCSIGSGPNCTLRLRARGVRPVHCLLLRGPGGTVLRSWAPNVRVNGEVVSEAVLEAGDLVSMGPIEFEVLPSEGPPVDPFDAGRTVVLDRRPAGRQVSPVFAAEPGISPLVTQPFQRPAHTKPRGLAQPSETAKASGHWRSRVRKLVGEVRKLRDQIDRFEQEGPLAEQHAADAALRFQRIENDQVRNQSWEASLKQLETELEGRQQQLTAELASLELSRSELDTERQAWQAENENLRKSLAQREAAHTEAQLAHQQSQENWTRETTSREAQLTAAAEALNRQRDEFAQLTADNALQTDRQAELEQLAAELNARSSVLDQRETDLAVAEAAVRRAEEELNQSRAEAHRELLAAQGGVSAAQERIAAERAELAARRDDLASHHSRLIDFEAELIAARQALAGLQESQEQQFSDRTAEFERLAAELAARELELETRRQTNSQASTDTVLVEPNSEHLAELQTLRQELAARTAELAQAQTAVEQANEIALAASIARETAETEVLSNEAPAAPQTDNDARLAAREEQLAQHEADLAAREATHSAALEAHQLALDEHQQSVARHQQALADFERSQSELHELSAELVQREAATITPPKVSDSPSGASFQPDPAELAALAAQREAVLAAELELEREREELRAEREALHAERENFNQERLRAADRLDADARELAEAREQLDAEREVLEARARRPSRMPAPLNDNDSDDADDEHETAAFSEYSPDRRGSRPMFSEAETERPPALDTVRSRQPAEDDDSIESHIAAFMNRLKSGQPVVPPVVERTLPKRRKSDERPAQPVKDRVEPAEVKPSAQVLDMTTAPMEVARRKAPEGVSSMNVLREIGLTHARSAIDTHGQQRSLKQAYSTLAVSAACLVGAFVVLYLADNAVMSGAGVVILVVAIYWMGSSIWAANKVVATIRRRRKGGLRAMLEEVDAEIAAIRQEAEAEIAAAAAEEPASEAPVATE